MGRAKREESERAASAEVATGMLEGFARVAETLAATTKKLEKAALLGAYFDVLSDDDLGLAARYFAGQQFAQHDARTTNVGTGMLRDAIAEVTGLKKIGSP